MKHWTVKRQITVGFATVLVMVGVLTITSFFVLRQAKAAAHFLTVDAMPGLEAMSQIDGTVSEIHILVLNNLVAKSAEEHKKYREAIGAKRAAVLKLMEDYDKSITTSVDRELFDKLKVARDEYVAIRGQLLDLIDAGKMDEALKLKAASFDPAFEKYMHLVDQEFTLNLDNGNRETAVTVKTITQASGLILGISLAVMVVGCLIATFITMGLNKMLRHLALSLADSSAQVASAAAQVSSSSQSLAEGASEQAASLEETSSSLEEMASMTQRNAENTAKANDFARETRGAADKGAGDMSAMDAAMHNIKTSSDDIAKIIKTIDEIAFQTNILALNAAVEAARAGEAGMGFAVVADEVRSLAQRSATAAKETASKIEGAINSVAQGVQISSKVAEALGHIVLKARQVDELVAEVASASREQTQGITQINTAVGQMDKVTQSNAANAEESAAAAEELNAQAEVMKQAVSELLELVGGATQRVEHTELMAARPAQKAFTRTSSPKPSNGHDHSQPARKSPVPAAGRKGDIPMDGDFKNF